MLKNHATQKQYFHLQKARELTNHRQREHKQGHSLRDRVTLHMEEDLIKKKEKTNLYCLICNKIRLEKRMEDIAETGLQKKEN